MRKTDAEAEAPILWLPDVKSWLIGKDPDAGKDWRPEEKGIYRGRDGWMASLTKWALVWASSRRWRRTEKPGSHAAVQGVSESWTWLSNWTTTAIGYICQPQYRNLSPWPPGKIYAFQSSDEKDIFLVLVLEGHVSLHRTGQLQHLQHQCLGQCCCYSVAKLCLTLCDPMDCSTPVFSVHHYLSKFAQIHVHWVSDAIQTSHPLLLLPSIFPRIRVFSSELALHIR